MNEIQYFVILTVQYQPHPGAISMSTIARTATVKPAATRDEIYTWALQQLPEQVRGGNVVFFSAEPNVLGGAT